LISTGHDWNAIATLVAPKVHRDFVDDAAFMDWSCRGPFEQAARRICAEMETKNGRPDRAVYVRARRATSELQITLMNALASRFLRAVKLRSSIVSLNSTISLRRQEACVANSELRACLGGASASGSFGEPSCEMAATAAGRPTGRSAAENRLC
jgi:hypothetical protein